MPQALAAFLQQLLNPLNLQPATGVEGLWGRRALLNPALLHHNPRGCTREMFNMNTDNPCASHSMCSLCVQQQSPVLSLDLDYCPAMSVICLTRMMEPWRRESWIIETSSGYSIDSRVQTIDNAFSLVYKVPLK